MLIIIEADKKIPPDLLKQGLAYNYTLWGQTCRNSKIHLKPPNLEDHFQTQWILSGLGFRLLYRFGVRLRWYKGVK